MTDSESRDDDMDYDNDDLSVDTETTDPGDLGAEAEADAFADEDVGPGSDDFEKAADELMPPPSAPAQTVPGDFKENWSLLFCCIALFISAMWLPMEGTVLDLTAKDSVAGGFLLVFSGYGMVACWGNIQYRKMMMKPVLTAAFIGLYVSVKRLLLLWTVRLPEMQEAAEAAETELQKNDYLSLTGSGTWAILLFSLGVFWTLVQSATSGRKRDLERKEAARLEKVAARKR